jgi:DNA polymerase III subunit gamma/tau
VAYLSLYRRRRPQTFAEMTGQEHITRTLSNALLKERLAHAYLFCGPRGTGKTTTAKILARAMNCEQYPTAEPCGKCTPCLNIGAGVSIDVIEMDAASNRGIDEIRELRERSRFASGESRFKVYIIDEAHMLTPEACNAFLKTLEEPPRNVVFILATTDPSRLPATIISRCQRFDFHLLTGEQILSRLELILKEEGWQTEDEALQLIARLSEGSLRDALGILEQCAAYGEETIKADQVRVVTGATRSETVIELVRAALSNDLDTGLKKIQEVVFGGRDLTLFMRDLTFAFSRLLLPSGEAEQQSESSFADDQALFKVAAEEQKVERHLLLDAVELLYQTASELRNAHFPQYLLEIFFIRLLRILHGRLMPAPGLQLEEVVSGQREKAAASSPTDPANLIRGSEDSASRIAEKEPSAEQLTEEEVPAAQEKQQAVGPPLQNSERLAGLREAWPGLIEEIKKRQKTTAAWLEPAVIADCRGHLVRLAYAPEYDIHRLRIMEESHRKLVEAVLSKFFQIKMELKTEIVDRSNSPADPKAVTREETTVRTDAESRSGQAEPGLDEKKPGSETVKKKTISVEDAQRLLGGKIIDHQ